MITNTLQIGNKLLGKSANAIRIFVSEDATKEIASELAALIIDINSGEYNA